MSCRKSAEQWHFRCIYSPAYLGKARFPQFRPCGGRDAARGYGVSADRPGVVTAVRSEDAEGRSVRPETARRG